MATTSKTVSGKDLAIFLGANMIGCATEVSLSMERAEEAVTCKASAGWAEVLVGEKSWGASASGIVKYYAATGTPAPESVNEGIEDFFTYWNDGTLLTLKFTTQSAGVAVVGDPNWTGTVYITSVEQTAGLDGAATYSISFKGTGALTKAANA